MQIISRYVEIHVFRRQAERIEFLMLKRGEKVIYPGLWQMVTGKIKSGEKAYEAALREVLEETGTRPARFWSAPKINQFYSAVEDAVYIVPVFAAELSGNDEIRICGEHSESVWKTPLEARELLPWEEQRKALDIVTDYITNRPNILNLVEIGL